MTVDTATGVWADIVGQPDVVTTFQQAVIDPRGPGHAWLVTGPPGSGRSNAAVAMAAALQCEHGGCGTCKTCLDILADRHPDVERVATEGMIIDIDRARSLVSIGQRHPAIGKYRIIVIEDADRLQPITWNVLLKAIEEPPERTLWLMAAPSPQDVLPTVRSRCRVVRLRVPDVNVVQNYLITKDNTPPEIAALAARASQSHIGIARRLARSEDARQRRLTVIRNVFDIQGVSDAINRADQLYKLVETETAAETTHRDEQEREQLLRALGVEPGKAVPPSLRAQVRQLEENQKRRVTRTQADLLDRALIDMQGALRDILTAQLDSGSELINPDMADEVARVAAATSPESTLAKLDAVADARRRVTGRIFLNRLLALEAMMLALMHT